MQIRRKRMRKVAITMSYLKMPDLGRLSGLLIEYAQLKSEYGAAGIEQVLAEAEQALKDARARMEALPEDAALRAREPDALDEILALRPQGPRRIWKTLDEAVYRDKVAGAMLARFAGCTLGAIVENWPVQDMRAWAEHIGDAFPPTD